MLFFEFIVTVLLTCNTIYQYDQKEIEHLSMTPLGLFELEVIGKVPQ